MSFDQELGARLRALRQMKRVSQECLGQALGVTFQQIQKYETGANRISPEKLDKCSEILNVPISYFFSREDRSDNGSYNKKILTIANAIASLPSNEVSKSIYRLVLALNDNAETEQESASSAD